MKIKDILMNEKSAVIYWISFGVLKYYPKLILGNLCSKRAYFIFDVI